MIAAADEPRVAAIVLNMPFQSGAYDAANFPPGLLQKVWKDREAQTASANPQPTYIPLWPTSKANARGEEGECRLKSTPPMTRRGNHECLLDDSRKCRMMGLYIAVQQNRARS